MDKINLKCIGVDLWGDGQTKRRYEQTLKRVKLYIKLSRKESTVLDVGGYSEFGSRMSDELELLYCYTEHDLNHRQSFSYYNHVFCFEVIEHLMNPYLFLNQLKFKKHIFLTYPYSPILQGARHFHEMTDRQFYTLIDEAGLKIVEHSKFRNLNIPSIIFSGVRPLIKAFMQIVGLSYINFYVLERK